MWIKEHAEITQHIPEDGKWHDVQVMNNLIWVDGELKNPPTSDFNLFDDFRIFDRPLTQKEIKLLAANKSFNPERAKDRPTG